MTAVANAAFTASQFNIHVRDNLNETAAAKATTAGRWFVATGANALAERAVESQEITTAETTSSTSYTDLATAGPAATVATDTRAIVIITAQGEVNTANAIALASFAISGATTVAADDQYAIAATSGASTNPYRMSVVRHVTGLTAGSNVFTMKYRTSAGTATFRRRQILVLGM